MQLWDADRMRESRVIFSRRMRYIRYALIFVLLFFAYHTGVARGTLTACVNDSETISE
jgi:hypothetical protein